jgi:hypothetical protein
VILSPSRWTVTTLKSIGTATSGPNVMRTRPSLFEYEKPHEGEQRIERLLQINAPLMISS